MVVSKPLRIFLRRLYRSVAEVTWTAVGVLVLVHFAVSWLGFQLAGEAVAGDPVAFLYYYVVTGTTVGYGDISPKTYPGMLFASAWVLPGGIALFTTTIAKAISSISEVWRKRMNGLGDYSGLKGASVIIGYHPMRTRHMIDEIIAGGHDRDIVLVSRKLDTSPDERVNFVKAPSLTDEAALLRAGVRNASAVAVYADDDEQTLAAALAVSAVNPSAHLVAFFLNPDTARLLKSHCAQAECVLEISVEQVVRAMQDPGSSVLIDTLASSTNRATIYSLVLPAELGPVRVARLAAWLRNHRANLMAFTESNAELAFYYDEETWIGGGQRFFFVRDQRLNEAEVNWSQLTA